MRVLWALVLCAALASVARGADSNGRYALHGPGATSCGTFAQAEAGSLYDAVFERSAMMAWAQGYLSAYNGHTDDVYDIYGHADVQGIEQWLYRYCWNNPLRTFADGLDAFISANYAQRIISNRR